ncbi:hypothetical protein [Leptothermofonsia sp. ETS-13]|uniref:hypothetical protein n=1 Tax=Leptothermofonsia sp. ETS-13 TaxID=3035696 RepID=UPI003BA33F95
MSMQVEGKIERKGFGPGTWALVSTDGKTYELHKPPADLHKVGLNVKIKGEVREDIMSFAMIGPILEVKSFEVLE